MMVFFAYGAHFLSFATTSIPYYNAIGYFNPDGSGIGSPGVENQTAVWTASYGKLTYRVETRGLESDYL